MIESLLHECTKVQPKTSEALQRYLNSIIPAENLFESIFKKYTDRNEAYQIAMFILYGYSEESPYLIRNAKEEVMQHSICEILEIPDYFRREALIPIKDKEILSGLEQFLDLFQPEEWKQLVWDKEEKRRLQNAINNDEIQVQGEEGLNGGTDWKTRIVVSKRITEMSASIAKREKEFKDKASYKIQIIGREQIAKGKNAIGANPLKMENSKVHAE